MNAIVAEGAQSSGVLLLMTSQCSHPFIIAADLPHRVMEGLEPVCLAIYG